MGPGMMKNWWLDLVITNTFSSLYDSVKTDRFYKMNVDTALPKNRRLAEIFAYHRADTPLSAPVLQEMISFGNS